MALCDVQVALRDCHWLHLPRAKRTRMLKHLLLDAGVPLEDFMVNVNM